MTEWGPYLGGATVGKKGPLGGLVLRDEALYVLDVERDVTRLLRIALRTGVVEVLVGDLLTRAAFASTLSFGLDGALLVGLSRTAPSRTVFARIDVSGRAPRLTGYAQIRETLLDGEAREGAGGIGFLAVKGSELEATMARPDAMITTDAAPACEGLFDFGAR